MTDPKPAGGAPPGPDFSFARRVALGVAVAVGVYALACALWAIVDPLLMVFLAVVFAIGLRGAALWVREKTRLPVTAALAVVVCAVYVAPLGTGVFLASRAGDEMKELREELPRARERVDAWIDQLDWRSLIGTQPAAGKAGPDDNPPEGAGPTETALSAMEQSASETDPEAPSKAVSWVTGFIGTLGSAVAGFLFVLVVSVYLAGSPRLYEGGLLKLFPIAVRPKAREVFDEITVQLRRWIIGQVAAGAIVATLTTVGLLICRMPMALMFGVLAGVLDFIPNFGPAIAALPAVLVASGEDRTWPVLLVFVIVQTVEGWLLRPFIEKRAVDTPPAVLLATQVAAGVLLGFLGLLLAPAMIVVVRIALMRLWIEEALGDDPDVPAKT